MRETGTGAVAPAAVPRERLSAPDDPIVRIEEIGKKFPRRRGWKETLLHPRNVEYQEALRDVRLTIPRGEFFGLLGRNGAGKTTLFKILATLILPDRGRATVGGHDVVAQSLAVRRRLVPTIPSERSLYWRLTARENLWLYAALNGFGGAERQRRVDEVLERVGLADTGTKQVGLFSSGMKQRLLLGRALLSDPNVLLLDEPTRSLDPVTARDLRAFLREEINERQGRTVLLATHDAEEVRELCHRVALLDEGRLLLTGTPSGLLSSAMEGRYRLVARGPVEAHLERMRKQRLLDAVHPPRPLEDGWAEVDVEIPNDGIGAPQVLERVVTGGIEVASFHRRELSIAELIETAVRHAEPGKDA